jgi:hypothetical protein
MDAERPEQHRVGNNMPEGTQFAERGPIFGGMSDFLRGATNMP